MLENVDIQKIKYKTTFNHTRKSVVVDQYKEGEMDRLKYHAKRIIDMLTNED